MNATVATLKKSVEAVAAEYKAAICEREDARAASGRNGTRFFDLDQKCDAIFDRYHIARSRLDAAVVAAYRHGREAFAPYRPTLADQLLDKS